MSSRLTPTKDTLNKLFALSGNQCAFPGCTETLLDHKNRFIGQVCHIVAASDGGERGESKFNAEDRRKLENLLVLCYPHHIATDDVAEYSVSRLKKMKSEHENSFRAAGALNYPPSVVDEMYRNEMKRMMQEVSMTLENTESLKESAANTQTSLDNLQNQLSGLLANFNLRNDVNASDFSRQIDEIMTLRDSKNQQAAMISLTQFRERNWDRLNPHEKYRTIANLGILSLEMNMFEPAGEYFVEAYLYEPGNIKAISIGALGYVLKKSPKEAMECINQAWTMDPLSTEAWYAYIMLNKDSVPYSELIAKIPDEIKADTEVAFGLTQAAAVSGNHSQSIHWAKTALDSTSSNIFDFKAALATCILQSLMNPYQVLSGQVSAEDKEKIRYAIALYTEAWDEIKDTALAKPRAWWLVNLGVARKFLPEPDLTYMDMLESCKYDENYNSLRHLAIAALEAGKIEKAIEVTDRMVEIGGVEKQEESMLFKIELIDKKGDQVKAIELLEQFLKNNLEPQNRYQATLRILDIYENRDQLNLAIPLNESLRIAFPEKIRPYIKKGRYSENSEELTKQLDLAYSIVDKDTEPSEIYMLIDWLQKIGDYPRATVLMEGITNQRVFSTHTQDLLKIYYNGGETGKLLALTESLIKDYGPNNVLAEYQALIYQNIGDYDKAINACENYLAVYPDDQIIMIRMGISLDKDGQLDKLRDLLSKIDRADYTLPLFVQENLALLFYKIGEYLSYLNVFYEARRQFIDFPNVHKSYVNGLMKEIPYSVSGDPTLVKIDDAVTVRIDGGAVETFIIEERIDIIKSNGEINTAESLSQALIGARLNEKLSIQVEGGRRALEILGIQPKYRFAFQKSLQLMTGKFFQESGATRIEVGNSGDFLKDFSFLANMLKEGEEIDRLLGEKFKRGHLTIGSIATRRRTSVIQIWKDFVLQRQLGLGVSMNPTEYSEAFEHVASGGTLVFDVVSLTTIVSIGITSEIDLLKNTKIICRSTFEELTGYVDELKKNSARGISNLKLLEGKVSSTFEAPDQIQAEIMLFQGLIEWISKSFKILPVDGALKINAHEKQQFDEITGACFIDSFLTAEKEQALIISEERLIRALAITEFRVKGTNVHTLLEYLCKGNIITEERFSMLHEEQLQLNYRSLPLDAKSLYHYAMKGEFQVTEIFKRAALGLLSPLILGDLSAKIAVDFFYMLYVESRVLPANFYTSGRLILVMHCIDILKIRFQSFAILENLVLDLAERKFRFLPLNLDDLRSIISMNFRQ